MLTEINVVVADLERSRAFYAGLGWNLRAITLPGDPAPQAWLTVSGPAPVTLHSIAFARWWDPSEPEPAPGSTTVDLTFDDAAEAADVLRRVAAVGGTVLSGARPMPWGQSYAILADPDGYRWGIKSPLTD